MSVTIMSRVFWTDIPALSYANKNGRIVTVPESTCKLTLLAIADNGNDYGEQSWQSFDTIAKKTGLNKRSVVRTIKALQENGYLVLAGISRFNTNNYTIIIDKLDYPPKKRTPIYASDSESAGSDSESKTSDSESPESYRIIKNHPRVSSKKIANYPPASRVTPMPDGL